MTEIKIQAHPEGSGQFTIAAPNSNNNRILTLPDSTTTLVGTDTVQVLSNKTLNGGSIVLDTPKAASGTSVEFIGIPSWVKRITMNIADISATTNDIMSIQLGTIAGWDGTGNYSYAAGAFANAAASIAIASSIAGAFNLQFANSSNSVHGSFVLTLVGNNTWIITGQQVTPTTYTGIANVTGRKVLTGSLDRIRLVLLAGGNFDAGTVNIMYEG